MNRDFEDLLRALSDARAEYLDLAGRWVDILRIEELNADWLAYHQRWAVSLSP